MSKKLYQRLIDNQSTAVLLLNDQLRIEYMNNAAQDALSNSLSRVLGEHIREVCRETRDCVGELEQALESGQPFTKREANITLRHGGSLTADYTVTPIGGEEEHLIVELFPRDRWLRISREESLIWQHEASRTLIRGMAHEIKNPLGGIRGAAQLLGRELTNEDLQDYTHIIIQEADRLRNLVDQMLGPNKAPKKELLNIHETLERVASLISSEAGDMIVLERDYDPSIPDINGNKEQLIQAILNITRNAMQSLQTQTDNERPQITLTTRTVRQITLGSRFHKMACRIDIIDNGPGISPELRDTIFYPMITNRAEGTGLGLTIAQQIINQHGGLIEYESKPGETRFIFFIPFSNGV